MNQRSYLYVPGDQPEKMARAASIGADALIIDLEDSVAPQMKGRARTLVARHLDALCQEAASSPKGPQRWLRINPGTEGLDDIRTVWRPAVAGVVVSKVVHPDEVIRVSDALTDSERKAGLTTGATAVMPLVESAAGALAALQLAMAPRVTKMQIGEYDLAADLGLDQADGGQQILATVRTLVVLASAAAGIEPPVAPVSTDFQDLDSLRRSTTVFANMGFAGRACIHPAQIGVINEAFTPNSSEIAKARELVLRFDAEIAAGRGVMVGDDGSMLDEATIRRARRLLARAEGPS